MSSGELCRIWSVQTFKRAPCGSTLSGTPRTTRPEVAPSPRPLHPRLGLRGFSRAICMPWTCAAARLGPRFAASLALRHRTPPAVEVQVPSRGGLDKREGPAGRLPADSHGVGEGVCQGRPPAPRDQWPLVTALPPVQPTEGKPAGIRARPLSRERPSVQSDHDC